MAPSPFGRNQWSATILAASIKQQLDGQNCRDYFVLMETGWIVRDQTVVCPDVAVCCDRFPERFIKAPPRLVIEVFSHSTAEKDQTSKRALYEFEKVTYYLMLNTATERFQLLRLIDRVYVEQPSDELILIPLHNTCQLELLVPRVPKN